MHGPGAVVWIGHSLGCSGGEYWAFGHGLLLDCEALRSRQRDRFAAALLRLSQRRMLTKLHLRETGLEWNVSIRFAMTLALLL